MSNKKSSCSIKSKLHLFNYIIFKLFIAFIFLAHKVEEDACEIVQFFLEQHCINNRVTMFPASLCLGFQHSKVSFQVK